MSTLRAALTPLREVDPRLIGDWYELGAHSTDPNPFAHPHFVLPAGDHLAGGRNCALLHVYDRSNLVFVLPVVRHHRYRRVPVRTIGTWTHPYCFLGAPLAAAGTAVEAWDAALRLLRAKGHAELLALELLPEDGVGLEVLEPAAVEVGTSVHTFDRHVRPVIHRRPEQNYFAETMSGKHRKNLRRQRRHLDAELSGQLRRVDWGRDHRTRRPATELFLGLERAGWKGRAGTAIACSKTDTAFFREIIDRFGADDQVQLWFFEASGTPVAGQCNLIAGDTVFHFKIAYDEELGGYSPGVLLELEMIEEFHEDTRLNHIDSCAAAGSMYEPLYPDRRTLAHALVPMHRAARPMAAGLTALLRRRAAARRSGDGHADRE
jgi:CelD/BcsL family acetyltransferase involved in cellulose biosynthesis